MRSILIFLSCLGVASCEKDESPEPPPEQPDGLILPEVDDEVEDTCLPQLEIVPATLALSSDACGVATCGVVTVQSINDCAFELEKVWADDARFEVSGTLGVSAKSHELSVRARPTSTPIAASINALAKGAGTGIGEVTVPPATTACLSVAGDVSFTTTLFGTVTDDVTICNDGPHTALVDKPRFEGDPDGERWSVSPDLPSYALPAEECLTLTVSFIGAEEGRNAALIFEGTAPSPFLIRLPVWGGPPAPWLSVVPDSEISDGLSIVNRGNEAVDVVLSVSDGAEVSGDNPGTLAPLAVHPIGITKGGTLEVQGGGATLQVPVAAGGAPGTPETVCGAAKGGLPVAVDGVVGSGPTRT